MRGPQLALPHIGDCVSTVCIALRAARLAGNLERREISMGDRFVNLELPTVGFEFQGEVLRKSRGPKIRCKQFGDLSAPILDHFLGADRLAAYFEERLKLARLDRSTAIEWRSRWDR